MRKMLKFLEITKDYFEVFHENGVYLGDLLTKDDGFYDWRPEHPSKGGCWPSSVLKELADKIDELNAPYEAQIEEYFNETSRT